MESTGAVVVIVTCILTHLWVTLDFRSYNLEFQFNSFILFFSVGIGLLLLAYPLLGYLADVHFTRYKSIGVSLLVQVFCTFVWIPLVIAATFDIRIPTSAITPLGIIAFCAYMTAIGLYEANAIQFGMDQLLEASSTQLSTFIHWYFWSQHVGQLVFFYVITFVKLIVRDEVYIHRNELRYENLAFAAVLAIQFAGVLISCIVLFCLCDRIYKERAGINPFHTVSKVLQYARKHKYPERRSAFTFWEEDIPSRIDLGKDKYGGPFTTEEVEDVKTFLRLLLLLVSMFGFHVAGDGFSVAQHMEAYSCPSLTSLYLIVINPLHISSLVVILSILFWKCLPNRGTCNGICSMNMLRRIGLGLLLLSLQEGLYTVLNTYRELSGMNIILETNHTIFNSNSTTENCVDIRFHNQWYSSSDPVDNMFLWLIGPQILHGLVQILVNMTALEFICAQSPRTIQGLLIGLWYAMFSIKYLIMGLLDIALQKSQYFFIYQGLRTLAVLLSVVFYSWVARHYKYRVRDDVVPEQWLIEDVFERRMAQEEVYWREQQALLDSNSS